MLTGPRGNSAVTTRAEIGYLVILQLLGSEGRRENIRPQDNAKFHD
jgi:hypothetical protein